MTKSSRESKPQRQKLIRNFFLTVTDNRIVDSSEVGHRTTM